MNARHREFPLFDSLRAIAFTCVFLTHASIFAGLAVGTRLAPFYQRLDVGVEIFFAISGFLLYRPFAVAHIESTPAMRTRAFAWRRVLRIVPPYWLVLTVVAVWIGAPGLFRLSHLPFYYGFAQVYNPRTPVMAGLPQAWSLCVEAAFYVFLALYAVVLRRLGGPTRPGRVRAELVGIAGLLVLGIGYNAVIGPSGAVAGLSWHFALPAFIDYFAIGMGLAVVSVAHEDGTPLPAPLRLTERRPALAWLAALVAFVVVAKWAGVPSFGVRYGYWPNLWRHLLYGVIALGLLVPAVFGDPRAGGVRRILALRPLLYIGMVSYAAYLLEFAVLTQAQRWGLRSLTGRTTPYLWFLLPYAATIALASLSWYGFERPILRLKRLVSPLPRRREPVVLEPPAAEVTVG